MQRYLIVRARLFGPMLHCSMKASELEAAANAGLPLLGLCTPYFWKFYGKMQDLIRLFFDRPTSHLGPSVGVYEIARKLG